MVIEQKQGNRFNERKTVTGHARLIARFKGISEWPDIRPDAPAPSFALLSLLPFPCHAIRPLDSGEKAWTVGAPGFVRLNCQQQRNRPSPLLHLVSLR